MDLYWCVDLCVNCVYSGDKIGLVLNNLGGTSNLEMGILANDAVRYLGMLSVEKLIITWWEGLVCDPDCEFMCSTHS